MVRPTDYATLPGISVVMAAHNEEAVIGECLRSVADWASELVVVDAASSDRTAAIAAEHGARVIAAPNELVLNINKNRAIGSATHEWVLVLDPDERVSVELAAELRDAASRCGCDAYWLPRRTYFLERWIRTMGYHPDHQLRFFRNGRGRFRCRSVHEKLTVDGSTATLRGHLMHVPPGGLAKAVHKQNLYSDNHALTRREDGERFSLVRLLLSPPHTFLRRYLVQSGWRDGVAGFVISVQAAYSAFLINAKMWEHETSGRDSAVPSDGAFSGAWRDPSEG